MVEFERGRERLILEFSEMKKLFQCSTWNTVSGCKRTEVALTEEEYAKFASFAGILLDWNKKINLTAIVDAVGISEKHFLDSVFPLEIVRIPQNATVIDVGTGAGFPAIPMKIVRDDIKVTLLDSLNKRVKFLQEVSDVLHLEARCVHARAEDAGRNPALREKFDVVTARAVAKLPVLCEYCLPFVKDGGIFLALKGPNEDTSAAKEAVKLLGGKIEMVERYSLPCGDERMLVVVRKISQTLTKFPRNSAQIAKKSL